MASSTHNSFKENAYGYGPPTQSGKIPFTPPGTNLECETAYWLWGDLDTKTTPLIVLHGGPAAPGRDWKPITVLQKRQGIPVLLYDQIGCGESTHLRDRRGDTAFWTDELFFAELDNIKRHFQIETFDLLGHSCGGMLASMYALKQPRGLRKLIIASAPASDTLRVQNRLRCYADLPRDMQDAITTCEKEGRLDAPEYQKAQREYMHRHLCRLDPWPPEMKETEALIGEDDTVSHTLYGPTGGTKTTGSRKSYDVIPRLHEITESTVPGGVLLTIGKYDMFQDEGMAPFFTKIRARVKWMHFAESSHMAQLEEPDAYLTALENFLTAE